MGEIHNIAGPPRAEPLGSGRVGARVRIPLTGTPSPHWSRIVTARLSAALTGHPAVGHLAITDIVQGAELVLEGVEAAEAGRLGPAISQALAAANREVRPGDSAVPTANMSQEEADEIAHRIELHYTRPPDAPRAPVRFPGR
jgi:hypothetical protein